MSIISSSPSQLDFRTKPEMSDYFTKVPPRSETPEPEQPRSETETDLRINIHEHLQPIQLPQTQVNPPVQDEQTAHQCREFDPDCDQVVCFDNNADACTFFFGESWPELQSDLQGRCKWLRASLLPIPALVNLTSRVTALGTGAISFWLGVNPGIGLLYGTASLGFCCVTGKFLGEQYGWSDEAVAKGIFGTIPALVSSPLGCAGMAVTNALLGKNIKHKQKEFFKQNMKVGSLGGIGPVLMIMASLGLRG